VQIRRVLVVYKKSLYQIYVREHRNASVKEALRRRDPAAKKMARSHRIQREAMLSVRRTLSRRKIAATYYWRGRLRKTDGYDLAIAVGGDGTVLDTAHRIVGNLPLLGINSDPGTSVGKLCGGSAPALDDLLDALESGALKPRRLARIRVRIDGHQVLGPCLNDVLFSHRSPAEMSRFELAAPVAQPMPPQMGAKARRLDWTYTRNSGIWICAATGASAAMRSAGGKPMARGSRRLQYLVREPFIAPGGPVPPRLRGFIAPGEGLAIVNRMRSARIWGDGVHRRAVVNYGQLIAIDLDPDPLLLVPGWDQD
jgi:NAD+ kinase